MQASYELGTLYYLGFEDAESGETIVAPNEREAFSHFERAAEMKHTGGLFMAADCLISGAGCDRDQARAVRLGIGISTRLSSTAIIKQLARLFELRVSLGSSFSLLTK